MILKKKSYLILGINTEVGKTFLMEKLCRIFPHSLAVKPVVSGIHDDDKNSDSAKILAAFGKKISKKNLDKISPWRFAKPVSPHFAGKIDFSELKNFCRKNIAAAKKQNCHIFIEAAGGVMTPLTDQKTFLDLAAELKIPVLLVSSNYLGSISQTLCAVVALKSRKIAVEKIIISEISPSKTSMKDLIKTIKNFSKIDAISMKDFLA